MMAGCAALCAGLSFNFYHKYRGRRLYGQASTAYSRIADYHGTPLPLAFEYRSEDGRRWFEVEVDAEEIYHYGSDYFIRGSAGPDRKGDVFKWNRIAKLRVRSDSRSLDSVEALLGAAAGRCQNLSSVDSC